MVGMEEVDGLGRERRLGSCEDQGNKGWEKEGVVY
jgi:hypothetical protein